MHDVGRPRAAALAQKSLGIAARAPQRGRRGGPARRRHGRGAHRARPRERAVHHAHRHRVRVALAPSVGEHRTAVPRHPRGDAPRAHRAVVRRYNDLLTPDPGLPSPAPDYAIARLSVELADPRIRPCSACSSRRSAPTRSARSLQLSTGEVVEVTKGGPRPRVRVVMDARGAVVGQGVEIDLAARADVEVTRVLGTEGWRKGEGATLDGDTLTPVSAPPSLRSASVSRERRVDETNPPSAPSRPSLGTSPSSVVEAVERRIRARQSRASSRPTTGARSSRRRRSPPTTARLRRFVTARARSASSRRRPWSTSSSTSSSAG